MSQGADISIPKIQKEKRMPGMQDLPIESGLYKGKNISGSHKKLSNGDYSIKFVVETHNKYGTHVVLTDYYVMSEHADEKLNSLSL